MSATSSTASAAAASATSAFCLLCVCHKMCVKFCMKEGVGSRAGGVGGCLQLELKVGNAGA